MQIENSTARLIQTYYEAFNRKDWKTMLGFLSEDVQHDVNQGETEVGLAKFAAFMEAMDTSYSEQVVDLVVMASPDGRKAAAEFYIDGTYLKTQAGLPEAHNQKYHIRVGAFFDVDVAASKIQRVTNYYNLNEWIAKVQNGSL